MAGKPRPITYEVDNNGCWICTSHNPDPYGYPKCNRNGRSYTIHRWIYMQYHNISLLPFKVKIRHTCDIPMCINPNHLLSGSNRDNMGDRTKRKRGYIPIGTNNGRCKLTEEDVFKIRANMTDSQMDIAKKYDIDHSTVCNIKRRRIWKHLK